MTIETNESNPFPPELIAGARAMEVKRDSFMINPSITDDYPWSDLSMPARVEIAYDEVFAGTYGECQEYIARHSFAAGLRALLPVSDELLAAALNSRIVFVPGTYQPDRDDTARNVLTAAIAHLAGME